MKKRIIVCLLALLLLCLSACGKGDTVRLGTGDKGGSYFAYGSALSALAKKSVNVKNTAGSAANIRLVKEGFLDMAIVQSDVLTDAVNGTGTFSEAGAYNGFSAVAALYTETCQIVVKAGSPIQSVAQLQGKRVCVGEGESGTLQNTRQILSVAGMCLSDVDAVYLSFTDAAKALQADEIDAFFCTSYVGMKVLTELNASTEIRLVGLESALCNRLLANYGGYTKVTVPAGTYKGQTEDITTVGVKAVLIAGNKVGDDTVAEMLGLVFDHARELKNTCNLDTAVTPQFAAEDITVPFHKGAKDIYAQYGITVTTSQTDGDKTPLAGQDD